MVGWKIRREHVLSESQGVSKQFIYNLTKLYANHGFTSLLWPKGLKLVFIRIYPRSSYLRSILVLGTYKRWKLIERTHGLLHLCFQTQMVSCINKRIRNLTKLRTSCILLRHPNESPVWFQLLTQSRTSRRSVVGSRVKCITINVRIYVFQFNKFGLILGLWYLQNNVVLVKYETLEKC